MPSALTYPGVYVEEIPSGVRTITGVPTSIAAFIGRAGRGPTDPYTITSWTDYERVFGGLDARYPLGYAVRDFYQNGGSAAVILRLYHKGKKDDGTDIEGVSKFASGDLKLAALSPGTWGDKLAVKVDYEGLTDEQAQLLDPSLTKADLFNLTIVNNPPNGPRDVFNGVTFKSLGGVRRIDRVFKNDSRWVTIESGWLDEDRPAKTDADKDPTVAANFPPTTDPTKVVFFTGGHEGAALELADYELQKDAANNPIPKTGLRKFEDVDVFNIVCIPPETRGGTTPQPVYSFVLNYCVERRALLIVDPPADWSSANDVQAGTFAKLTALAITGERARNAAVYFPRVLAPDPLLKGQSETFVPCGMVAGVMARTDVTRGVWVAPAGIDASLNGATGLSVLMTDAENGLLNPAGINCFRTFPLVGSVVWGARTMRGADVLGDEYKYIPVRRLALYIEESVSRGLKWVVFQPNFEPLWAQIRLNVGAFMNDLFRDGAFAGSSPRDAYFVKCDKETTTQNDINKGVVNIVVGFAPLKPAEFVVLKVQQIAGQIQT